jgi:hypothetical protein
VSLTRGALQADLVDYIAEHPLERDLLLPLLSKIEHHFHASGMACADCPVILTAATVVSENHRVLHFWHPHRHQWALREDFAQADADSMIHSAYRALVAATGIEGVWVQPANDRPLLIEVSHIPADMRSGLPRRLCHTYHYLFRTLEEHVPMPTGPWRSAKWIPVSRLRNTHLRSRVAKATSASAF